MLAPSIAPGIKQALHFTALRIDGSQVCTFVLVANRTTQRQIAGGSFSTMFYGDNVIDLVLEEPYVLQHQAILALAFGPSTNFASQRGIDIRHRSQAGSRASDTPWPWPS